MRVFLGSTTGLVACFIVAAVGGWLLWSHTGHALSALPFLVLLACPLMHLMHRDHDQRGSEHGKSANHPADGKSGKEL